MRNVPVSLVSDKFMLTKGNGYYGDRIYVHESQTEARKFLSDHCKWGGHDKTLINDDGDQILSYECGDVEILVCLQAMIERYRLKLLNLEETKAIFNLYSRR